MKIFFESETDKQQFKSWLINIQNLATNIETTLACPSDFKNPEESVRNNAVKLWYRVFDINLDHLYLIAKTDTVNKMGTKLSNKQKTILADNAENFEE
jgi:predicted AlkP superfamily phosphohydrolase/phosphomutase